MLFFALQVNKFKKTTCADTLRTLFFRVSKKYIPGIVKGPKPLNLG